MVLDGGVCSAAGCSQASWNLGGQLDAECIHAEVCVFLLCHNDDAAVAPMRAGASSRPPAEHAWSQQPAEKLWLTGGFWAAGLTSESKQLRLCSVSTC